MLKRLLRRWKRLGQAYNSIDECPVKIWFKVHKDGDLSHLIIKGDVPNIAEIWESMYNDYITRFGLPESFIKAMEAKNSLAKLQADYIITGHKYLKTQIAVKKEELKNKVEISEPEDIEAILAKISKWYGFQIKSSISVAQYYAYINEVNNG